MYNHKEIESKWQKFWEENNTYKTENISEKPKWYSLDMFPYPSGAGLHVGHPKGYTANDVISRFKHANGYNVLHPMGWDAFGLPAENYAIKTGTHPRITTDNNIQVFKKQIKKLGISYDWDREIDTTDPNYYKWTQWIFLKLFEHGLAYEQDLPINYCPSCKTGLANEEVLNDFTCERCGAKVEKKKIRQWVLAITKYAERLLKDVDKLDWPESIKEMQRNWIGKSEGCEFRMEKDLPLEKLSKDYFGYIYGENVIWEKENTPEDLQEKLEKLQNDKKCIYIIKREGSYVCIFKFKDDNEYIDYKVKNDIVIGIPITYGLDKEKTGTEEIQTVKDVIEMFKEGKFFKTIEIIKNLEEIKNSYIDVYTTRIDTVFGMTYAVLAPDHPNVWDFVTPEQKEICKKYIEDSSKKSDQDRTAENKEKTGVFTGSYVINPFNNKKVPLWIADYVLGSYGTGAVMAVPAHDERDFEFAKKYSLEIVQSIAPESGEYSSEECYTEDGILVDSGEFTSLKSEEARKKMTEFATKNGFGVKKVNYKLRDWLFSRQRYWGEPIPLIHIKDEDLEKIINLNFYDEEIIKSILDGSKTIETRALNPEEKDRFFGDIQVGDMVTFTYKKDKYLVKITKIDNWNSLEELFFDKENLAKICPNETFDNLEKLKKSYSFTSDYVDRIEKNGLVGFSFEIISKIYDGLYSKIICDYNLPLKLPEVKDYLPSGDGKSPLAKIDSFVKVKLGNNLSGERETNTMPQWGGSCWYYLRFMDAKNPDEFVGKEVEKYWGQVDSYVGGAEHAVLHLLYARFWHKFLFDIKLVSHDEPFFRLRNQGLIQAHAYQRKNGGLVANDLVEEKDGKYFEKSTGEELERIVSKMSKSLKNVVNPDDIVEEFGADSLRLYEMYLADFRDGAPWETKGIIGVRRFLEKSERLFDDEIEKKYSDDNETMKLLHKTIKKVGEDIEAYKFNTAIAALMILVNNGLPKDPNLQKIWKQTFVQLLHPFAPYLAEELWERIGNKESVFFSSWPKFDEKMTIDDKITIGVQVCGKIRGEIEIDLNEEQNSVLDKAKSNPNIAKWLEGKQIIKEIYVPNKIVNIIVK